MKYSDMTKAELIDELVRLRHRLSRLEKSRGRDGGEGRGVLDLKDAGRTSDFHLLHKINNSDITEHNRTEESLRKTEVQFKHLVENSPVAMCVISFKGIFEYINEKHFNMYGYTTDDIQTIEDWHRLAFPDGETRDKIVAEWDAYVNNIGQFMNKARAFIRKVSCKDGSVKDVEIRVTPIQDKFIVVHYDLTERIKAEEQLRLTQFSMDNIRDTVVWIGPDARFKYVNDAACKALGYTREELLGMGVHDIDPEFSQDVWPAHWEELRDKGSFTFESTHKRSDGSIFPVEIAVNYLNFGGSEYNCAFARDISERKRVEQTLRVSDEKYNALFKSDLIGVAVSDVDGKILDTNSAYQKMLGYSEDELKGIRFKEISHPDQIGLNLKLFSEVLGGKRRSYRLEKKYIRKDGTILWVDLFCNALFDEAGKYRYSFTTVVDITERKQAEEALKQTNETLSLALEVAGMGSWEWDISSDELRWSSEVINIFGLAPETDKSGRDKFIGLIHPDDRETVIKAIKNSIKLKRVYDVQYRIVRTDGAERQIHAKGTTLYDESGKAVKMIGLVYDITERKRAEEELQKAQKLESIGVLAGGIAHDFNNLLTAIFGNVQLAKMYSNEGGKAFTRLSDTEKSIETARNLTQQLLTFAKGGKPIKKTLALPPFLEDSVRFSLSGSNVGVEFSFDDGLHAVDADRGQLGQVFNNLVINANEAMPEGGTIGVTAENTFVGPEDGLPVKAGPFVTVKVRDSGVGISGEHLSKVFDPYFSTKQKGSGLGLATAYSIVSKHGGHLTVQSRPGQGSVFTVYLPASKSDAGGGESRPDKPPAGQGRVLVMDDEKIVREVLREILIALGYSAQVASDGEEAVSMFQKAAEQGEPFDAFILDLTVPGGMGGVSTINRLLKLNPGIKAIVSSGYADDPIMADYRKYGFKAAISKPFELNDMGKVLRSILSEPKTD